MTHTYDIIPDNRNISTIERRWDSPIDFSRKSNTYKLLDALTTALDSADEELEHVYAAQHVDSASGGQLDNFGDLVNVPRSINFNNSYGLIDYGEEPYSTKRELEDDDVYRARIKANFRASTSGTTWDEFVEFTASVLDTSIENITFATNYDAQPATINVFTQLSVFENVGFNGNQIEELLGSGVPAGHSVDVLEGGTFRLKEDGGADDVDAGLTSDSIETGGTLAGDLV